MIQAIDVAVTQMGVHERTGRNDGIPAERYMRGDELAWCAGFVMWCFDQGDGPSIYRRDAEFWPYRKVSTMCRGLKDRGLFLGPRVLPQRNDIVFFGNRMNSDSGPGTHVAIVEDVEPDPGRFTDRLGYVIRTIGGNESDKVKRSLHAWPDDRIVGFARMVPGALHEKPHVQVP